MNQTAAIEIGREAIMVVLTMSVPIMAVALFVGLIIALFQALTQLQEMTLVFVPKIVVVFGALIFFLPFMLSTLSNYMNNLADRIIGLSENRYRGDLSGLISILSRGAYKASWL